MAEAQLAQLESQRRPLVELLLLAGPSVAQMSSYTLMQFIDRKMLAHVGYLEATAAGTAGITYFCFLGFGFGILLLVNTLVSQSFGRNDLASTGRYMWQGIWLGLFFGALTAGLWPFSERLFQWMGHEQRVAVLEGQFLRVAAVGGWAKLASVAMAQCLLGLQRPLIVFVAALCGVVANIFFNWLLIYGNWGMPALGVAGSAWGTNGAVVVELMVMAVYLFRPAFARVYRSLDWRPRWDMFVTLVKVGLPAGFQLICEITAWNVFMNVILAGFGTASLSANSFAFMYMHVCFMPAVGIGAAVTALVGKYIGMGRSDLSIRRAHLGFVVCAVYMVVVGIVLWVYRYPLIGMFTTEPQVLQIGATLMGFVALYQIFDAMFLVYVHALRGAGDTLVPAVVQTLLVWGIVVGAGSVVAKYAPQYGITGPWIAATIFGAILGIFLLVRFQRGKWKQINLRPDSANSNVENDSARLSVVTES